MKNLLVITFADKELSKDNLLKKSCKDLGLDLEVLICTPWTRNAIKLKLLYEFLSEKKTDQLLLIVDAFDVILFDTAETITKKFKVFNTDILFSTESNYMFKNQKLWLKYFRTYPKQPTIYNFLNSGSYIGSSQNIQNMLEIIQSDYGVSLLSSEELDLVRSDQYLLHRFYVDNFYKKRKKLKVSLDAQQEILGCTGGRLCIRKFKDHSKAQAYLYFKIERNLVKLFRLHEYQSNSKDYKIRSGRFYNLKTQTIPSVMHLPGTWGEFSAMFNRFYIEAPQKHPTSFKKIVADIVSYFSYISSLFLSVIIYIFMLIRDFFIKNQH